jgi:SAM-dependent methyltransferase
LLFSIGFAQGKDHPMTQIVHRPHHRTANESNVDHTTASQDHIWSKLQSEILLDIFAGSHVRHAALMRKMQRLARTTDVGVLNIGVGDGNLERQVAAAGWRCAALDPDAEAIARLRQDGIDAQVGYIRSIPFADACFDFVVASEVFEHLSETERAAGLFEIRRVLKPGGALIGTVPYDEDLNGNVCICPSCEHIFHRFGHTTSYTRESIRAELREFFDEVTCSRTAFVQFKGRTLAGKLKSLVRFMLGKRGSQLAFPNIFFVARKPA